MRVSVPFTCQQYHGRAHVLTIVHPFIHVKSVENVGTRKKRKENMRKAIDVETKKRKNIENV